MNIAGVNFYIEDDELISLDQEGAEIGREPLAAANMNAEELAVRVKAACYANSE